MISDVLFDAREHILDYLKCGLYGDEARREIADVVLAMDRLRMRPGFDCPPGLTPPTLPADAIKYLNALLTDRATHGNLSRFDGFLHIPEAEDGYRVHVLIEFDKHQNDEPPDLAELARELNIEREGGGFWFVGNPDRMYTHEYRAKNEADGERFVSRARALGYKIDGD